MHLLYITLGNNTAIHSQAAFSVYSILAKDEKFDSINIITDAPDYYAHFKNRVRLVPVTSEQLNNWKGPHQFFWRIKIKALQWMCEEYAGKAVVYLDADTFWYGSITELKKQMTQGFAVMHEDEGRLSVAGAKTEKLMWSQVKNRTFAGLTINEQHHMWNAGVVACSNTKGGAEINLSLKICDELCGAGVTQRLNEQFALSVALQHTYRIKPAQGYIAHYWSNKKEWNSCIHEFFTEAFAKGKTTENVVESMKYFDFTQLPVKKKIKNTSRRLHNLIDQIFAKEQMYLEVGRNESQ